MSKRYEVVSAHTASGKHQIQIWIGRVRVGTLNRHDDGWMYMPTDFMSRPSRKVHATPGKAIARRLPRYVRDAADAELARYGSGDPCENLAMLLAEKLDELPPEMIEIDRDNIGEAERIGIHVRYGGKLFAITVERIDAG